MDWSCYQGQYLWPDAELVDLPPVATWFPINALLLVGMLQAQTDNSQVAGYAFLVVFVFGDSSYRYLNVRAVSPSMPIDCDLANPLYCVGGRLHRSRRVVGMSHRMVSYRYRRSILVSQFDSFARGRVRFGFG